MSNEAEDHLIALRKAWAAGISNPEAFAAIRYADKLIAEREPKIMSAEDLAALIPRPPNAFTVIRDLIEKDRANIAAVLDKKLADAEARFDSPPNCDLARRIIADTLRPTP